MTYITAIHVPIAGLALLPIVMGLPPLLLPAHVVLMELILDPLCSVAFEAEPGEADAMLKPPRKRGESLFGAKDMALGFAQGFVVLLGVLSVYVIELGLGANEPQARGLAFSALIVGNLALALGDALPRGVSPFSKGNASFWAIAAVSITVVMASLFLPQLAALLRFEAPSGDELAFAMAVAVIAGGWYGVFRRLFAPL
jgi:Ca2+-transporting ATPase